MAKYMSGENATLNDDNNFNNYYLEVKEQTKVIPNINDLIHGNTFVNDNYNGYDLSYLSVRYLSETLTPDEFKELMPNFKKIKELGNDIVQKMFNYYDSKLEKTKSK